MGLQVAAAGKIINEFTGLAFAGGEFETDNPAIRFVSAEAWTRDAQGAHITFATAPIGSSSPVEGMRLTSEGILLVGTDTASGSAKLQVSGAISVSGITYAGTLALSATGANPITFSSGGTEGFRLAPTTRNLLVGTTTDDGSSKLQVAGTSTNYGFTAYNSTVVTGVTSAVIRAGAGQGTTAMQKWQNNAGTDLITIDQSGQLRFTQANTNIETVSTAAFTSNAYNDGSWKYRASTGAVYLGFNSDAFTILTAPSGTAGNAISWTTTFKVNNTGIGFFGATPVAKQTVTADAASILAALQAYGLAV